MVGRDLSLETRIGRLEVLNRFLLFGVAGLLLVGLAAASDPGEPLRAGAFQLVDAQGRVRAELAIRDGQPGL